MAKYFMTSVADAYLYDSSDNLVGISKAMMDSSMEVTTQNTDVRGGKGNVLQYILFHGSDLNMTLTDTQFNLDFLARSVGDTIATGANVYTEETVTLGGGGAGTVLGTPLAIQGSTIYGWVTHVGVEAVERVTFTGSNFTSSVGSEDDVVCVRYYAANAAAKQLTVYANVIPSIVRVVLDAQLASSNASGSSANVVGKVEIVVPQLILSGGFSLAMTPDAVANTPITGRAIATTATSGSCAGRDVYGYITRVIDSANWYDDCIALAAIPSEVAITDPGTQLLVVKAIHEDGSVSIPPTADLTFAEDSSGAVCTVSAAGLITSVGAGSALVSITITAKTSVDAFVDVTVS